MLVFMCLFYFVFYLLFVLVYLPIFLLRCAICYSWTGCWYFDEGAKISHLLSGIKHFVRLPLNSKKQISKCCRTFKFALTVLYVEGEFVISQALCTFYASQNNLKHDVFSGILYGGPRKPRDPEIPRLPNY